MLTRRLQSEKIDDVDEARSQRWKLVAQNRGRGQRLDRCSVARARNHNVRIAVLIGRSPVSQPYALGTMPDSFVHRKVFGMRLFVCDNHVHVVDAP